MNVSFTGNYLLTVPTGTANLVEAKLKNGQNETARKLNENTVLYITGQDNKDRNKMHQTFCEVFTLPPGKKSPTTPGDLSCSFPDFSNEDKITATINEAYAQKAIKIDLSNLDTIV